MTKYEIKHRFSGDILFSAEVGSLKLCVEAAVSANANLNGAYLCGANLNDANLNGANLNDANLNGASLEDADLCDVNLNNANLCGASLVDANLNGAYLCGANLNGAYLCGANLGSANLCDVNLNDANLNGANLCGNITIQKTPIQIYGAYWNVTIWDAHMQIGCEFHSFDDWFGFDSRRINSMSSQALRFWRKWKDPLLKICVADRRYEENPEEA